MSVHNCMEMGKRKKSLVNGTNVGMSVRNGREMGKSLVNRNIYLLMYVDECM